MAEEARAAVVQDGIVTNVIMVEFNDSQAVEFGLENSELVLLPEDSLVSKEWSYSNGEFIAPPEPDESSQE